MPASRASQLVAILGIERPCHIVDIGANPIGASPSYQKLVEQQLGRVVGFEPQKKALAQLNQRLSTLETYLPYAIGDGSTKELKICSASGMTSTLEPDPAVLETFGLFREFGRVTSREKLKTFRLDDVQEIHHMDLLKIDIQGGELEVFKNSEEKLSKCAVVHTEVSFIPLYKGQPTFSEVDLFLRSKGFLPHCFAEVKRWIISPMIVDGEPRRPLNQLLEADVVYCRNFINTATLDTDHLKYMALIADICYQSFDLALRCIKSLEARGVIESQSSTSYIGLFNDKSKTN